MDKLSLDAEERARMPGYRDEAVLRHFDAPEALSTRFYEVRAKSILNRVPEASEMPFRWTINPYRGCTHACSYCMSGDTQILMADGRTTAMREIRVGDLVYGTTRADTHRKFAITTVLDKWSSLEMAHDVRLEDETRLIASGRHRFLTSRGWSHASGAGGGEPQRPHLDLKSRLLGLGGLVDPPSLDSDYRQGYLCGVVRETVACFGTGEPATTAGHTSRTASAWL
ncbi:MAG: hypothetical protein M3022_18455 [Actinomycetota bacterium]|nr:hypothetical protein [Actinomycetota bacterium]